MGEKGAGQRWFTDTVGSKAVDLELSLSAGVEVTAGVKGRRR